MFVLRSHRHSPPRPGFVVPTVGVESGLGTVVVWVWVEDGWDQWDQQ